MGMHGTTYIGPYFRCVAKTEIAERKHSVCSNNTCSNFKGRVGTPFCSTCGSKPEEISVPYERLVPRSWDFYDSIPNLFEAVQAEVENPMSILLPNVTRVGDPGRKFDPSSSEGSCPIDPGSYELETEWLGKNFTEEWRFLEGKCGKENVHIEWGVVFYVM